MGEILSVSEHPTLHQTPPTLSLWQCALEKKKKTSDIDTLCCETLIAAAAVCLQLEREQCRSCECVGVCVSTFVNVYGVCMHVLSLFALVFYKCGGGGCVLSRHSV